MNPKPMLHPELALRLLSETHVRILRTDGKEMQGTVACATDRLIWIEQPHDVVKIIVKIIPWTAVVVMTVGDKDNDQQPYGKEVIE
jgi:hypothetical protein